LVSVEAPSIGDGAGLIRTIDPSHQRASVGQVLNLALGVGNFRAPYWGL
jgi:hypothetical protein